MSIQKLLLWLGLAIVLAGAGGAWYFVYYAQLDIYVPLYVQHCQQCHGDRLQGTELAGALVDPDPKQRGKHWVSTQQILSRMAAAHAPLSNVTYTNELSDEQIKGLAIFVGERQRAQRFAEFKFDRQMRIPDQVVSEQHNFRMETVAQGLEPLVFSIQPLPDGRLLVTEKERGLSIVDPDSGSLQLIKGTPETGGSLDILGVQYGNGWLLDVATHPDYAQNSWIYLHYTHLCAQCGGLLASSMNRLDRGRIVDGAWVDVQTLWQAPLEFYSVTPDTGAGGRIAFDDAGHVFISVGIKSADEGDESDKSPQDLDSPYGKIHRIRDDGSVPEDNPYALSTNPLRRTVWTYGHRSPQGLEWHPQRGVAWNSEMGARGGDELNELLPGHNYGWPFHSRGLEYSGTFVARHLQDALEFDLADVTRTLVDITPSPAISSFIFYTGQAFPKWQHNVLIGSLKGSSLFRMVFDGDKLVHIETLLHDVARIRDIEVGDDGLVYLLLESKAGSRIVKLVPVDGEVVADI